MKIQKLYKIFKKNPNICIDSRKAETGSIFFGIKGDNFDGNKFVSEALKKCSYAIIDNPKYIVDKRTLLVKNSLSSLQALAKFHRHKLNIPILAITGTNGKTTTKELIRDVLSQKYKVVATSGNLNNHIGVPLTLLSMNDLTEFGIVEMGANHLNEIANLCNIANPDFGIITNIGKAHLEGFGSFDNIIKAKNELYKYLINNAGVIFKNAENKILNELTPNDRTINYYINDANINPEHSLFLNFDYQSQKIATNLVGIYNIENILAAISVGNYFNIDMGKIKQAIENYKPSNIRSQYKKTKYNQLILDNYNANPSSMAASIQNFSQLKFTDCILILGDMFELGKSSSQEHKIVIDLVHNLGFKMVFLVGKEFYKHTNVYNFEYFISTELLISQLKKKQVRGKHILLKGSRGMQLEKLVEYL